MPVIIGSAVRTNARLTGQIHSDLWKGKQNGNMAYCFSIMRVLFCMQMGLQIFRNV
jgi:hypothetical protein